ncbi:reverse transcriptase [Plakobranchus ocellatus]|uniref:Reverse transcriptase n=1 Tax=Plakobranchus ocellatus TaxID=259542 RepID=A0AAV3ZA16_9GAST|nr:reverse transcriptase [Plakobranchus ocellatus]
MMRSDSVQYLVEGSQATTSIIAKQIMVYTKNKYKANDVKGWPAINRPVSSGRGSHVPQVTLDRHLVTACKTTTTTTKIATWNVRTMLQKGKLDNIKLEMERMKIDILGLSEVRWQGAGVITSGNYKIFYSGGTTHERGVGIILDKEIGKAVKGYWTLSDRIILLKFKLVSLKSDDSIMLFLKQSVLKASTGRTAHHHVLISVSVTPRMEHVKHANQVTAGQIVFKPNGGQKHKAREKRDMIIDEIRNKEDSTRVQKAVQQPQQGQRTNWDTAIQRSLTWNDIWHMAPLRISFLIRSVCDLLPSHVNLVRWGKKDDPTCPLCQEGGVKKWHGESITINTHRKGLLGGCDDWMVSADLPEWERHPDVIRKTALRPDIVIHSASTQQIIMVELTVPYESRMEEAHAFEEGKYLDLTKELKKDGYEAKTSCYLAPKEFLTTIHGSSIDFQEYARGRSGKTEGLLEIQVTLGKTTQRGLVG